MDQSDETRRPRRRGEGGGTGDGLSPTERLERLREGLGRGRGGARSDDPLLRELGADTDMPMNGGAAQAARTPPRDRRGDAADRAEDLYGADNAHPSDAFQPSPPRPAAAPSEPPLSSSTRSAFSQEAVSDPVSEVVASAAFGGDPRPDEIAAAEYGAPVDRGQTLSDLDGDPPAPREKATWRAGTGPRALKVHEPGLAGESPSGRTSLDRAYASTPYPPETPTPPPPKRTGRAADARDARRAPTARPPKDARAPQERASHDLASKERAVNERALDERALQDRPPQDGGGAQRSRPQRDAWSALDTPSAQDAIGQDTSGQDTLRQDAFEEDAFGHDAFGQEAWSAPPERPVGSPDENRASPGRRQRRAGLASETPAPVETPRVAPVYPTEPFARDDSAAAARLSAVDDLAATFEAEDPFVQPQAPQRAAAASNPTPAAARRAEPAPREEPSFSAQEAASAARSEPEFEQPAREPRSDAMAAEALGLDPRTDPRSDPRIDPRDAPSRDSAQPARDDHFSAVDAAPKPSATIVTRRADWDLDDDDAEEAPWDGEPAASDHPKGFHEAARQVEERRATMSAGTGPFSIQERMLAFRYLRARRKEGFISVIASLSLLGIALGVAILIIVMSVMNGFRAELVSKIVGVNGHLMVMSLSNNFTDYREIADRVRAVPGVTRAAPLVEAQAFASAPRNGFGVIVRGMTKEDLLTLEKVSVSPEFSMGSLSNFEGDNGVAIGHRLALKLGLNVGDSLTLISPRGAATPFGVVPRKKSYPITYVFKVGMANYDEGVVFMPLFEAQKFFNKNGGVDAIEVMVATPERLSGYREDIEAAAERPILIGDWQESNRSLIGALKTERTVMFLILSFLILIASLIIIAGMIMLVKEKGKDIAILRTMGMSRGGVMRVFFMCGASIGLVGTVAGVGLGLLFCAYIDQIADVVSFLANGDVFPEDIYILSKLPAQVHAEDVVMTVGIALGLSFLATLYPAWRAARLDPVEALRYE